MQIFRFNQAGHVLNPENRKRNGRPFRSWQSDVTVDLREAGLTWENFSEVTISCAQWRSCVAQCAFSAHETTKV